MKLWMKNALFCTGVLFIIVSICSTLLLIQANSSILALARESTYTQLKSLKESVDSMVDYYGSDELEPIAKRSLIKYFFSKFADKTFVLISEGETLYSQTNIEPEKLVSSDLSFEGKYDGKQILIFGSAADFLGDSYTVYIVKSLSGVHDVILRLVWKFAVISIGCIAAGIVCIVLLTRFSTKPLKKLSEITSGIAKGEYGKRAIIKTKDEIGMLARDFNTMADAIQTQIGELKETAERQRLFIGGLTHEFKTPMTSIIMYSETILYAKLLEKDMQSSLFYIHEQCKWLEQLTQKLLKIITLNETVEMQSEPVGVLMDAVCMSVGDVLETRGIDLAVSCEIDSMPMDIDLMKSALVNLVMNAANASKPGQTVRISAYDKTMEVADHGKGIPENERERITEPFYIIDRSRGKKAGGSGLGLALVKQIVRAHGAKLVIDSEVGKGTTVRVVFQ